MPEKKENKKKKAQSPRDAKQERIDKCKAEIAQSLDKHGCKLDVSMIVEVGKNTPIIKVASK